jgi:small subunit ribosomal protein S20
MPNTRQSAKRVRQTARRTDRNERIESATRTVVRLAAQALKSAAGGAGDVQKTLQKASTALAKAASKGAIPAKRAARKTRRLVALARKLQPNAFKPATK